MALRVEVVFSGMLPSLATWAAEQAAREGISTGELMARCLEAERRRLSGKRLDPRTRRVGVNGADAKMAPGTFHTGQVAEILDLPVERVRALVKAGAATSSRPTRQGVPAAYTETDCVVLAIASQLEVAGVDAFVTAALACTEHLHVKARFIVVGPNGRPVLVSGTGLVARVTENSPAVVVALDTVRDRVHRRITEVVAA